MSVLFNHACRYELFDRNPIRFVRQSAKRRTAPTLLAPMEIKMLVEGLDLRERTLVLLAASTGLRQGELFGLKWGDIDFAAGVMNVTRSVVYGIVGPCKTESSQKPVPLHPLLAENLAQWRERSANRKSEDWVFASRRYRAGNRAGDTRSYADAFGQRRRTRESKNASDGILFAGLTQHF